MKGPLSKQKCSYYRYRVTERRGSGKKARTVVIEDRNERVKFFCRDMEGVTLVDPEGADVTAEVRALAEVCLVLFNSNEFIYVY